MITEEKLIKIKTLLSAHRIADILKVSIPTVESWTKTKGSARKPGKINSAKIDDLYNTLKPCFDNLKNYL